MLDWNKIPSGNYLVRGDLGALLRTCGEYGQVYLVDELQELEHLEWSLLGDKVYYLYKLNKEETTKNLPSSPPPPGTYRLVVGLEKSNYKHPPAGYQYLDARSLGSWQPALEFLEELKRECSIDLSVLPNESFLIETLLKAVLKKDVSVWNLKESDCYRLFGQEENSGFFKYLARKAGREQYRYTGAAYAHWCCMPDIHIKYRVLLYGAWLVLLQHRQNALKCERGFYFFEPKAEPGLYHVLGFPEVVYGMIEGEAELALSKIPELEMLSI